MRLAQLLNIVIYLLCLSLVFAGNSLSAPPKNFQTMELRTAAGPDKKTTEIIVKFRPTATENDIQQINARTGGKTLGRSSKGRFARISIPADKSVDEMIARYSRDTNVLVAEPNYLAYAFLTPDDALYPAQWNFQNDHYGGINIEDAWDISRGDATVIVAVIDTGVAYENYAEFIDNVGRRRDYWLTYEVAPDLADTSFIEGYDFVNNDPHANDDEGHGTHVTGTIAQSTNNSLGVAGIAHFSSIMPIKVLDDSGAGTYTDIAEGIYFAADHGAHIINLSLGGSNESIILEEALAYAYNKGVTIICASGNDGSDTDVSYPAAYDDYCIAVGATRYDEQVADYSNRGPSLDLTAPGGDTNLDQNNDGYADGILQQTFAYTPTDFGFWFYQGTSMAAPHVSGIAALLLASGQATTPNEVRHILQATAKDMGPAGYDTAYGWGIVDAAAALQYSAVANTPPVAAIDGPFSGLEDTPLIFDGRDSYDLDGDSLTYRWDFGDNHFAAGITPSHTYQQGGDYIVTLVVNDGKEDSEPATQAVSIADVNDRPVADAGGPYAAFVNETISLDGSGSFDPEGSPLIYTWNFGDGTFGTGVQPEHAYSESGVYTLQLVVNDGEQDSFSVATTAEIGAVNTPPIALADGPYHINEDENIIFDGSLSYDPEGALLSYTWDFGDGSSGTGKTPSHVYTAGGLYTVKLTVDDGELESIPYVTTAEVTEINDPPLAIAGQDINATPGEIVIFDGRESYDPESGALTYTWNFGDGTSAEGAIASHSYSSPGTFEGTLTVMDPQGATAMDQILVTITENSQSLLSVGSIEMALSTRPSRRPIYNASATVTIVDTYGTPVPGTTVTGHWSGTTTDTDILVTDEGGRITAMSDRAIDPPTGATFTFTIDQATLTDWSYDPANNTETSDSISLP